MGGGWGRGGLTNLWCKFVWWWYFLFVNWSSRMCGRDGSFFLSFFFVEKPPPSFWTSGVYRRSLSLVCLHAAGCYSKCRLMRLFGLSTCIRTDFCGFGLKMDLYI